MTFLGGTDKRESGRERGNSPTTAEVGHCCVLLVETFTVHCYFSIDSSSVASKCELDVMCVQKCTCTIVHAAKVGGPGFDPQQLPWGRGFFHFQLAQLLLWNG